MKYPLFNKEPHYVFHHEDEASDRLSYLLDSHLPESASRELVLICIGTDRSTGDSLGPLVGSKLEEQGLRNFHLYGTLDEPVHALNLEQTLTAVKQKHFNPFVIAVDACLGKTQSVGSVSVGKGPSKPGAAMNKQLPAVGNMHIHGIVNVHGFMEFFVLQNTRLNLVMKMAQMISTGILATDHKLSVLKKINHL
nr:spore protease YyaC [Ectobacillus ponti]